MKYVWDIYMHHAIYCDRLGPITVVSIYEASGKLYLLCNDIFIYIKITKRKQYSNVFFLVSKHLHTYIMIKILYSFSFHA